MMFGDVTHPARVRRTPCGTAVSLLEGPGYNRVCTVDQRLPTYRSDIVAHGGLNAVKRLRNSMILLPRTFRLTLPSNSITSPQLT